MIPGVTVDPALTDALLATIPADIVASMSPQMREVMAIQATRADECRRAGEEFAAAAGDLSPAAQSLAAQRAEYRAERTLWNEGGPTMARTDDHHIRTAGVDVPIRIHRPTTERSCPVSCSSTAVGSASATSIHMTGSCAARRAGGFAVIGSTIRSHRK